LGKTEDELKWSDILVDLDKKSDDELKKILDTLYLEEEKFSRQRRILHGEIDIIRAEIVERLKKNKGVVLEKDIARLTEILAKGF